jgi:hypothetical protein
MDVVEWADVPSSVSGAYVEAVSAMIRNIPESLASDGAGAAGGACASFPVAGVDGAIA